MKNRVHLFIALAAIMFITSTAAFAQGASAAAAAANREKLEALKPPPGAKVAIVVFEDLQCPDCARAHPLLDEMSAKYKIPVKRFDFPLPMHNWAFRGAVINRYFETKSEKLAAGWRDLLFKNQASITPQNIDQKAAEYARANGTAMPFLLDPGGKLDRAVKADFSLGQRIGVQHTPTIWVVTNSTKATPFVEVVDRSQISRMIEEALAQAGPAATPAKGKSAAKKKTAAK